LSAFDVVTEGGGGGGPRPQSCAETYYKAETMAARFESSVTLKETGEDLRIETACQIAFLAYTLDPDLLDPASCGAQKEWRRISLIRILDQVLGDVSDEECEFYNLPKAEQRRQAWVR
jgi:hypothetical protein